MVDVNVPWRDDGGVDTCVPWRREVTALRLVVSDHDAAGEPSGGSPHPVRGPRVSSVGRLKEACAEAGTMRFYTHRHQEAQDFLKLAVII